MKNFIKSKAGTALILIATLALAGIAIFTAIRLFQLRQEPVAPNVPTSKPKADVPLACTALSFTLTTPPPTTPPPTTAPPTTAPPTTAPPTTAPPTTAPPVGGPTATPKPTATKTPTPEPTEEPALPDAGTSWPTIIGAGAGVLILVFSLLLAL